MRTMASGDKDMFRVVIVMRDRIKNPEHFHGSGKPYWVYTDTTHEEVYGPYNTLAMARSIRTQETRDYNRVPCPGVVRAYIQKAVAKWEVVE